MLNLTYRHWWSWQLTAYSRFGVCTYSIWSRRADRFSPEPRSFALTWFIFRQWPRRRDVPPQSALVPRVLRQRSRGHCFKQIQSRRWLEWKVERAKHSSRWVYLRQQPAWRVQRTSVFLPRRRAGRRRQCRSELWTILQPCWVCFSTGSQQNEELYIWVTCNSASNNGCVVHWWECCGLVDECLQRSKANNWDEIESEKDEAFLLLKREIAEEERHESDSNSDSNNDGNWSIEVFGAATCAGTCSHVAYEHR